MENKVRVYRKQKKVTQAELSKMSGVSRTVISGIESGRIENTTFETLRKISTAFGKPINDVFFGNEMNKVNQCAGR